MGSNNKQTNSTTAFTPPTGPSTTGGYYTSPANNNSPFLVNKNFPSPQQPASTYDAYYNNPSVIPDYSGNSDKTGGKVSKSNLLQSGVALVEGLSKASEWLGDAMYYSKSLVVAYQLRNVQAVAIVFGNEQLANTAASASQYMSDPGRIAEAIAFDYTDMVFDAIYSIKGMSAINDSVSDFLYRDTAGVNTGFVYSVLKNVGAYAPAIVASSFGDPLAQASVVAAMSYGENLESNCQVLVDNAAKNGEDIGVVDFAKASGKAGLFAVVDGSVVYASAVIKGPISNGLKSLGLWNVFSNACGAEASFLVKSLKPYVEEAIDTFVYKVDDDGDGVVREVYSNDDFCICNISNHIYAFFPFPKTFFEKRTIKKMVL